MFIQRWHIIWIALNQLLGYRIIIIQLLITTLMIKNNHTQVCTNLKKIIHQSKKILTIEKIQP
jgi:hypothetical protein